MVEIACDFADRRVSAGEVVMIMALEMARGGQSPTGGCHELERNSLVPTLGSDDSRRPDSVRVRSVLIRASYLICWPVEKCTTRPRSISCVEENYEVLRLPRSGDDVDFSIVVEIGSLDILDGDFFRGDLFLAPVGSVGV